MICTNLPFMPKGEHISLPLDAQGGIKGGLDNTTPTSFPPKGNNHNPPPFSLGEKGEYKRVKATQTQRSQEKWHTR